MPPRKLKKSTENEVPVLTFMEMEVFDSDTPMLTDSELSPQGMAEADAINMLNAEKIKNGQSICEENWTETSAKTLTNTKPTESETLFIFAIMCHMKGRPDIDWDKVAHMCGYTTPGVAQVRWGQIKRKLGMASAEATTSPMKARAVHTPKSALNGAGMGILRTPTTARQETPSKAARSTRKTPSRVRKNAKSPVKLSAINENALRDNFTSNEFPDAMDPFVSPPTKQTFEPAEAPMDEIRAIKNAQEEAARNDYKETLEARTYQDRKVSRRLFGLTDDRYIDNEASPSKKGKGRAKLVMTPMKGIARKPETQSADVEDLYTARFAMGSSEGTTFD
ncbi:hypothetical protein BJ875DRAFT_526778 [Amylocarpus encephaloides]|uniref:Myb-like DNA-binding domain-containing protein n=1 Tax=Amylocarpus encephaloides TaxID=45428 RepID=A0A9P8C789_9HELO|nr:hypothetical protein BJ875DRAFT_526778 [Amylocarpus encephaloides]